MPGKVVYWFCCLLIVFFVGKILAEDESWIYRLNVQSFLGDGSGHLTVNKDGSYHFISLANLWSLFIIDGEYCYPNCRGTIKNKPLKFYIAHFTPIYEIFEISMNETGLFFQIENCSQTIHESESVHFSALNFINLPANICIAENHVQHVSFQCPESREGADYCGRLPPTTAPIEPYHLCIDERNGHAEADLDFTMSSIITYEIIPNYMLDKGSNFSIDGVICAEPFCSGTLSGPTSMDYFDYGTVLRFEPQNGDSGMVLFTLNKDSFFHEICKCETRKICENGEVIFVSTLCPRADDEPPRYCQRSDVSCGTTSPSIETTIDGYTPEETTTTKAETGTNTIKSTLRDDKGASGDKEMHLIMVNVDNVLQAGDQAFEQDYEAYGQEHATARIMSAMHLASVNANHDVDFMLGTNMGYASRKLNRTKCETFGIVDRGEGEDFALDPDAADGNAKGDGAIQIPADFLCSTSATHSVLTIIRNRRPFVGGRKYNTISQKKTPVATFAQTNRAVDPDPNKDFLIPPAPNKCDKQQYLQDTGSVFTASAIDGTNPDELVYIRKAGATSRYKITANIRIDTSKYLRPLHGDYKVSWWDTTELSWADDQECTIVSHKKGQLIAECDHLTDFTLLVDGVVNDPCLCDDTLIVIGYIITSASIICLFIMLTGSILAYFHTLRRYYIIRKIAGSSLQRRNKLTLLYNITLFLFYLVFTIFSDQKISGDACDVFGAISYILLMGCILLTVFQALRTVSLFYSDREFMGKFLRFTQSFTITVVACYGTPTVLTIFLFTMTNFFQRQDGYCWIRSDYIIYGIVIPLSFLLLNAIVCTLLVVRRLFCMGTSSSRMLLSKNHISQRVVTILLMQLTLGTPWILQYLAIFHPRTTVWHYLFTIVNGSQGVLIFLLWLYRRWRQQVTGRAKRSTAKEFTRETFVENVSTISD
ncbi:unnamed protein product, partial [Mesorhabditis belari]|uniref:G-protein coupled receptors family 2 profile 2 domain-containing protein n=1 Tax=Mesorhabditis belari TaxID=2138241 RepID=A0AAF3EPU0_9BILA